MGELCQTVTMQKTVPAHDYDLYLFTWHANAKTDEDTQTECVQASGQDDKDALERLTQLINGLKTNGWQIIGTSEPVFSNPVSSASQVRPVARGR